MSEKADLSPAYDLETKEEKGQFVYNALRDTAERTQKELRRYLGQQGANYRSFFIANKVLVQGGTEGLLTNVASRSDVARITANHLYQLEEPVVSPAGAVALAVEPNISFVNADDVWVMGYSGEGTVLAGNDTGIDWDHPAIKDRYRGWNGFTVDHNYNWWDATHMYPSVPGDGYGHGTHTTGTMVGEDGADNRIGMAPEAQTIHCKNMNDGGSGNDAMFTECFEWDLAPWDLSGSNPRADLAPDAINNSWGYWGGGYTAFKDEIAALQAAGIVVEVSAGNDGPGCGTLGSPGDYDEVLTTGSVNHSGGSLPGTLTGFSSRGPSALDPGYFPDVMAPGEGVRSSVPGGGYSSWSGTSMAGPHATALVGLMWSANRSLRGMVDETLDIIRNTAVPLTGQTGSGCGGDYDQGPNNDWGYGTIDAEAAVEQAMLYGGTGTLEGVITDGASNPVAGATIRATLNPSLTWQTTSDLQGDYSMAVFSGTHTLDVFKYGHLPAQLNGVSVSAGMTTTQHVTVPQTACYTLQGTVTDDITGDPLWANIHIAGHPVDPPTTTMETDPATGNYSLSLAGAITYTLDVSALLHNGTMRVVPPLTESRTESLALSPTTSDGVIAGWVLDEDTGAPVVNATVQVEGGPSARTDADGYYHTPPLAPGYYTATASAHLYSWASVEDIEVRQSNVGWASFQLPTPRIDVRPKALSYTLQLGDQVTQTSALVISNTGEGGLSFGFWERSRGFEIASQYAGPFAEPRVLVPPEAQAASTTCGLNLPAAPAGAALSAGDVIQSWASGRANAWGIAYDGANGSVWVGDGWGAEEAIFEYAPDGAPTGRSWSYGWMPGDGPADSAFNWNTGRVWTLDVGTDDCIHEMDPTGGYTGNTICGPWGTSQRGVAYDPDSDTWYVGGWNEGIVYHIDPDGNLLDSANVGLAISGLAYNPYTRHLFAMVNT
jgi:subtilisin family serine protease